VLDLNAAAAAALDERLQAEAVIWLTTVDADGQPQSSPVWFLWHEGEFLVYAQPRSWKVRNIRAHPQVALNLNSNAQGGRVDTFEGMARLAAEQVPVNQSDAYLAKYGSGITSIGSTPEKMAAEYSTAVRVTPTRVRVF
jgi:PPOX class probable F420-dependent enzyme